MRIPGLALPAILAAVLLSAGAFASGSRAAIAIEPTCQTMLNALTAEARASGRLDQDGVTATLACVNGTSSPAAGATDVGNIHPGVPIAMTIRGTLYAWTFPSVEPIPFCDTLRTNGYVDGGGSFKGNHYVQHSQFQGREGWFWGSIAIVIHQSAVANPPRWVTWWGIGSVSQTPC